MRQGITIVDDNEPEAPENVLVLNQFFAVSSKGATTNPLILESR